MEQAKASVRQGRASVPCREEPVQGSQNALAQFGQEHGAVADAVWLGQKALDGITRPKYVLNRKDPLRHRKMPANQKKISRNRPASQQISQCNDPTKKPILHCIPNKFALK